MVSLCHLARLIFDEIDSLGFYFKFCGDFRLFLLLELVGFIHAMFRCLFFLSAIRYVYFMQVTILILLALIANLLFLHDLQVLFCPVFEVLLGFSVCCFVRVLSLFYDNVLFQFVLLDFDFPIKLLFLLTLYYSQSGMSAFLENCVCSLSSALDLIDIFN